MSESQIDYRATLNLPDTPFPMRGELPKREPDWVKQWNEGDLYQQLRAARKGKEKFTCTTARPTPTGKSTSATL